MKRYDSAKKKLIETYQQCQKLKGNNNPELVVKLVNLAIIDTVEGNYEQALERLQKAHWIVENHYGQNTIKYVEVLIQQINTCIVMNNFEKANQLIKSSISILNTISPQHYLLIELYSNQANIYI